MATVLTVRSARELLQSTELKFGDPALIEAHTLWELALWLEVKADIDHMTLHDVRSTLSRIDRTMLDDRAKLRAALDAARKEGAG